MRPEPAEKSSMTPPRTLAGTPARRVGAWIRTVLGAVGRGRAATPPVIPAPTDRATQLAVGRTQLALERTFLAAERTLMAWVRTSLSMISFGFTMVKFFEYLEERRKLDVTGLFGHSYAPESLGLTLITIGTLALVAAALQHRQTIRGLGRHGLAPRWSLALTVATVVGVLGIFAFGSLVMKY